MSPNYQIMRLAILAQKPVTFDYKGYRRLACPHVLGLKRGLQHALTFQYGGGSSSGLPPGGEWRCVSVAEVSNLVVIDGPWHTGLSHTRPQTCVDQIDVQVPIFSGSNPYSSRA